jgi:predicted ATPase
MLGDLYLGAGRHAEATAAADDGLTTAARTKDHYWDSELNRLKGEIVMQSGGSVVEAETHFKESLADARLRDAKSLELRTAMSLARLMMSEGRTDEARALVRPVFDWFTEGLSTSDLITAKQLVSS